MLIYLASLFKPQAWITWNNTLNLPLVQATNYQNSARLFVISSIPKEKFVVTWGSLIVRLKVFDLVSDIDVISSGLDVR